MAGNEYQDLQMQECHIYSVLGATSLERSSCESNFLKVHNSCSERKLHIWKTTAITGIIVFFLTISVQGILIYIGLSRHPLPLTHPSMAKASLLQELLSSNCKMNGTALQHCELGWIFFNGKCYFFSQDIMNWTSSKAHCEKKGSSLVVINNKDEQDFLANTVKSTYWLGLSRTIAGYWIWQDTSHLNNNNAYWNFGQPDKNGKENCVSMVSDPKGWNDDSCSKLFRGICEKDIWIRVPLNYLCDKNVYPVI
ncbi:hypothetical protein FKM82_013512 [Ascaphus truei]